MANTTLIFSIYDIYDQSKISTISWYFGDGSSAGGQIVYHQYNISGIYQVQFVISDVHANQYHRNVTLLVIPSWNVSLTEIDTYNYDYINNTIVEVEEGEGTGLLTLTLVLILIISAILAILMISDIRTLIFKFKPTEGLKRFSETMEGVDEDK